MSMESQLETLQRLVPHLARHGCDVSAQDGARELMRYFDAYGEPPVVGELAYERRALHRAYTSLRDRLTEIAEGRSRHLSVDAVATFTRFYREHMLRIDTGQKAFRRGD